VADNQLNMEDDKSPTPLIEKIVDVMKKNTTINFYNLQFNIMTNQDAEKMISCVEGNKAICKVDLSDHVSQKYRDRVKELTKRRKPKKKKKKR